MRPPPEAVGQTFDIHDLGATGWANWGNPLGSGSGNGELSYHHTCHHDAGGVAPATIDDLRIYELCFELDTDGDPESAPYARVLPRAMHYTADYLDAFVMDPNHSWDQSTDRTCGGFEIQVSQTAPVVAPVPPTVRNLSEAYIQPQWLDFARGVEVIEDAASASAGVRVTFESTRAWRLGSDAEPRSVVLRFRGPYETTAPVVTAFEVPLIEVELFFITSGLQAQALFQQVRDAHAVPGTVLVDQPTFKSIQFGSDVLYMHDRLLLRWRALGGSRVDSIGAP